MLITATAVLLVLKSGISLSYYWILIRVKFNIFFYDFMAIIEPSLFSFPTFCRQFVVLVVEYYYRRVWVVLSSR